MVFLLKNDGVFECRKSEQGQNAGNGVYCVNDVKAGTILPYYAITISDDDEIDSDSLNNDSYRMYVVSADYTTAFGNQRTAKGLSMDGDPRLPQIQKLETYKKLACQTNEAGHGSLPNCLLVSNPSISRADIKRSLLKQVPILVTYVVVIENLPRGTELLTCYGSDYGERGTYSPCEMTRRTYRKLIDRAYEHVDALPNESNVYT